jgi:WD40 repeat protein
MRGEPIEAVKVGLDKLLSSLRRDPYALESVYLSLITFDNNANVLVTMAELSEFHCPEITLSGNVKRNLGLGLELLLRRYKKEVKKTTADEKGDWLPIAVLMTSGDPSDMNRFETIIFQLKEFPFAKIITCVTGTKNQVSALKRITKNIFSLDTMDSHAFSKFWQWVSTVAAIQSHSIGSDQEILPPPPQEINPFYSETDLLQSTNQLTPLQFSITHSLSDCHNARTFWRVAPCKQLRQFSGHALWIFFATFSSNGRLLVTVGGTDTVRIWDVVTGKILHQLKHNGYPDKVNSASFSPDGKFVVTSSWDGAHIWNTITGEEIRRFDEGGTFDTKFATFSPDGKFVVTAEQYTAQIWEATTGKKIREFNHSDEVFSAIFSPDGKSVVTASKDNTARIWDTVTGKLRKRLVGHSKDVNYATFSPNGKFVITASDDKSARIWNTMIGNDDKPAQTLNMMTGNEVLKLEGHKYMVNSAVFSPDGNFVLTAGSDQTARIWDATTGKEICIIKGHSGSVNFANFSPDGKYVITASLDGTARIWGQ